MKQRQLRFPLLLLLLALIVSTVTAKCVASNCIHGTCATTDVCECDDGYSGPDCSVPFEDCGDGERKCYNGSECVRNNEKDKETGEYKYHCDCSKAFDIDSFAGIQCEYASTVVCEANKDKSEYAFCTNGGECLREVISGQPHEGCECPIEFEGSHCQYRKGEAPEGELQSSLPRNYNNGGGMSGVATFFIVAIVLGVVAGFGVMIWKKKRADEREALVNFYLTAETEREQHQTDPEAEII